MAELSPAAQAVLEATYSRWPRNREWIIAAALRAAVEHASPERQVKDIPYVHQLYIDGMRDALAAIEDIAIELENHQ